VTDVDLRPYRSSEEAVTVVTTGSEEGSMRKLGMLAIVVMMMMVVVPLPASADRPVDAAGEWTYIPDVPSLDKIVGQGTIIDTPLGALPLGPNVFISNTDVGTWTGTLEGTSYEDFVVVIHKKHATYHGSMTFDGCVMDSCGELVIRTNGSGPWPPLDVWSGTWVIVSGTDELSDLRGQGSWWGPLGDLDYDGKVHFS
jgi:hypothetical protein